ncbi:MAG: hypothetical protein ACI4RN_03505 [Oscillospiraceae bacterium]
MINCKPAKRSVFLIYFVSIVLFCVLFYFSSYLKPFLGRYMQLLYIILCVIAAVVLFVILPVFFKYTSITITNKEIIKHSFFALFKTQYMSMESVTSVTTAMLPLSKYTGFNFMSVNALGANMIMLFMKREDCIAISKYIEENISKRVNK